jgi:outer membrane protein TolC
MSGPTTPARAWPEVAPNTPIATAIASSKSLLAAENAIDAVRSYVSRSRRAMVNPPNHMITK